jgi:hypothetical protein
MKKTKKIKVEKKQTPYNLKPKTKKKQGGKAITKQNKVVEMPNDIKPNSISALLWKAQRQTIRVKKTKFTHDEIFKTEK